MAGRVPIPEEASGTLDRCWLLNANGEWEPARNPLNIYSSILKGKGIQKLGPGYGFAQRMLEVDPEQHIGLIVNARGGSKIEQWKRDSKYYRDIIERTKAVREAGQIKGVLWHQGESNSGAPDSYMSQLKTLISNLRTDLGDAKLLFVAGQISNDPPMEINDV